MSTEEIKQLEKKLVRIEQDIVALSKVSSTTLSALSNTLKRVEKLENQAEDKAIDKAIEMYQ